MDARERGGRDRRGRGRGWGIGAPGEEGRVEAEQVREGSDEIDEVGGGENPRAEVRGVGDEAGAVDEGVVGLDDHVACWGEEDEGRRPRVGLREPEDSGEVVGGAGVVDGDGAVGLEEVGGAAVVVGEEGGLGVERGESVGEGDEVVADQPLHVLRVGQGGGPALGERRVQELVRVLRAARRRWGRRRRWRGHRSRSPPLGFLPPPHLLSLFFSFLFLFFSFPCLAESPVASGWFVRFSFHFPPRWLLRLGGDLLLHTFPVPFVSKEPTALEFLLFFNLLLILFIFKINPLQNLFTNLNLLITP